MKEYLEKYQHLCFNNGLEGWIIWLSLYIQYYGYYVCLYLGFLLLVALCIIPFFSLFGLIYSIKIKIKTNKDNKQKKKFKDNITKDYINTLDTFKKKKKHK
jgi:hypothetical protein